MKRKKRTYIKRTPPTMKKTKRKKKKRKKKEVPSIDLANFDWVT